MCGFQMLLDYLETCIYQTTFYKNQNSQYSYNSSEAAKQLQIYILL